ncbi:MAG: 50S ribosomal protein L21 [Nitrospirales bacterium]
MGQPEVDQAHVKATVVRNDRTRSITIFKKKRRKGYRRTKGHRQGFTQIRIEEIIAG